ncbi:prepilin-type N-terminal cleavage/methylation domain-containing protein [Quadrisphaera granulorum]|uniref:Prepilin-type N-terminal cleavage/methylation domain-containing protein n=1 Tax=Quadrisphaera granulorum TaxID=317664 RepID=A0A315ZQZ1_9ACTN|nr:Ig-like domain-containing protein [Quadrisphaera granulorum]PWJ47995.1 prepilin-type N-terminal cleavage/methylation domain-containing protein [Quadrisphaera granulorum]SZE98567.1 prepilin-type N-terminal cleavage/methylation domain-containing protein [Quadrisphaera granulorum]
MDVFRRQRAAQREPRPEREAGFTLIEVVVALVLLVIVATAALRFSMSGISNTAALQQRQGAVAVANQAMEQVRAVVPNAVVQTDGKLLPTGLAAGRNAVDVAEQWSSAGLPNLSQTWQASDPAATTRGSSAAVLPLSSTPRVGKTDYAVKTFIGLCDRASSSTSAANTPCQGVGTMPTSPATGYVRMVRAFVQVTWTPVAASACATATCSYVVTTLIDPNADLTWNVNDPAVAVNDNPLAGTKGNTQIIDVLGNDTGASPKGNDITTMQTPGHSNPTLTANDAAGTVTFQPNPGWTGTYTFQYKFTTSSGVVSNVATVTVTVKP